MILMTDCDSPKLRKLIAWFGFSNSNRPVALKLLTVAASTGNDVHGLAYHFNSASIWTDIVLAATLHLSHSSRIIVSFSSVSPLLSLIVPPLTIVIQ